MIKDEYKNYPPACVIAFVVLRFLHEQGFWNFVRYKRTITRLFYECTKSIASGWISEGALEAPADETTADHYNLPQLLCYFLMDNWKKYCSNIKDFYKWWEFGSRTIKVRKKENTQLSGFSYNSKETGNLLRVSATPYDRYKLLGIVLTKKGAMDVIDTKTEPFPSCPLGETYNKWVKENMMLT